MKAQLEMLSADTKMTNLDLKNFRFHGKSNAKQDIFCPGNKKRSENVAKIRPLIIRVQAIGTIYY